MLTPAQREKLAEKNLKLVYYVVNQFINCGIPYDELFSVAIVGFAKAINTYDSQRNVKFSTYAYNCIKNEILFFLRKEKMHLQNDVSLNKILAVDKKGNNFNLEQIVKERKKESYAEEVVIEKENMEYLEKVLNQLSDREYYIIAHRYGLNNAEIKTQKEIAEAIGMSQANVSKLEKTILEKIKRLLFCKYKITGY